MKCSSDQIPTCGNNRSERQPANLHGGPLEQKYLLVGRLVLSVQRSRGDVPIVNCEKDERDLPSAIPAAAGPGRRTRSREPAVQLLEDEPGTTA